MVRGDELMKLINLIVKFLISHVHPFHGLSPVPVGRDGTRTSEILEQLLNAPNTILNQNIRNCKVIELLPVQVFSAFFTAAATATLLTKALVFAANVIVVSALSFGISFLIAIQEYIQVLQVIQLAPLISEIE
jgi:hypothetical protein